MSQDSIGVVTTGRSKLQEWKTTQKQNLSRKSRGTLTVKWAGSRDKIFSPSGRGRTLFLTSLFIELIDPENGSAKFSMSVMAWSIKGDVKNIFLPPPEARVWFATSSPSEHRRRSCGFVPWVIPSLPLHLRE